MTRFHRLWLGIGLWIIAALLPAAAIAAPRPAGFRHNDAGGFRAILPPGTNGLINFSDLIAMQISGGDPPPHSRDQLAPYANLVFDSRKLTNGKIGNYFHDASFGVKDGNIERTYSPRADVTIVRDQLNVPHIYGSTRAGTMYGLGYAGAEDRLFMMDALRHAGRGELSNLAGGANREMDRETWADTPYTEADLQAQFDFNPPGKVALAKKVREDVIAYVAGINGYIAAARANPTELMPGEYTALNVIGPGGNFGPTDWKPTDIISTAALVGGIFGKGGGRELDSALMLTEARAKFGAKAGSRVWKDFRSAEDPEAPTTVHKKRFNYLATPANPRGQSIPDPGSVVKSDVLAARQSGDTAPSGQPGILDALSFARGNEQGVKAGASNALVVSGRESKGGHPVAVFGPQVSYYTPQILMEQDVHGPGIDARGASFTGINLYVLLGRGRDYAWSATSAGQDIVDTFSVPTCEAGGGTPAISSDHYLFRGKCLPIEKLTRHLTWVSSLGDPTPPGAETLTAERTKLGIVEGRGTVKGKPVLFTKLRSTYDHEAESAYGFRQFNDPGFVNSPKSFQRAASNVEFTFNWLYTDARDTAYFNSGANPVRARDSDASLPIAARHEWKNFKPATNSSAQTPFKRHPQVINQNFMTSWNNKQAKGFRASDDTFSYGAVYRSTALDQRVRKLIKGRRKATPVGLTKAMEDAATVDLRGATVLPYVLQVLKKRPVSEIDNPAVRTAITELTAWQKSGAHRIDRNRDGTYEHADAIRILDAWWDNLLRAEFEPTLGTSLFNSIASLNGLDDSPDLHLGSAYNGGWYVYSNKDLRTVLKKKVKGRYSRVYCGQGSVTACRTALLSSLEASVATNPYGDNAGCGVGDDQMCFDAIKFTSTGGIKQPDIAWQNRPTFQQVVQVKKKLRRR